MTDLRDLPGKLAGLLDELFSKVFKKSLDIPSIERLHTVTRKLAILILQGAERVALERCKKLNDATKFGFTAVGEDVSGILDRLDRLEEDARKAEHARQDAQRETERAYSDAQPEPSGPSAEASAKIDF